MTDPCARAEVLADVIMNTPKDEKNTAPIFDDYILEAHCLMTTHVRYGDTTRCAQLIAADLREFVERKISASSPLLSHTPQQSEKRNPLSEPNPGGGGGGQ